MTVRIHNTSKWAELEPGKVLELPAGDFRNIRVQVNCMHPSAFYVVEGDKRCFLAVVQGLETLEFSAGGNGVPVHLVPTSEGEVWFFTNEGDVDAFLNENAVSFTKIASRRARNPDLERMMFKMEQNMLNRIAQQDAENRAWRQRMEEKGINPDTGEVSGDGAGATGESGSGAAGATEGASTGDQSDTASAAGATSGSAA